MATDRTGDKLRVANLVATRLNGGNRPATVLLMDGLNLQSLESRPDSGEWHIHFSIPGGGSQPHIVGIARCTSEDVQIIEVSLRSDTDIKAAHLRFPLGEVRSSIVQAVRRGTLASQVPLYGRLGEQQVSAISGYTPTVEAALRHHIASLAEEVRKRPGARFRPGRTGDIMDRHYRAIATWYLAASAKDPHRTMKTLLAYTRAAWAWPDLSRDTLKTWVRRAAEQGWLTKGTRGKAGRDPGPRLITYLGERRLEIADLEDP